jgi:hypothetical protein
MHFKLKDPSKINLKLNLKLGLGSRDKVGATDKKKLEVKIYARVPLR